MAVIKLPEPPEFKILTPQSVTQYFVDHGIYKLFEYQADISETDADKLVKIVAASDARAGNIPGNSQLNFSKSFLKNILTYQISEVSVPALAISKTDISKANESPWPVAVQTATPGSLSIKFKCDQDLTEWKMLHRWKNYSANRYGPRFLEDYAINFTVFALKPDKAKQKAIAISRIDIFNMFPLSITSPEFKQNVEDADEGWFIAAAEFGCSHIKVNGLT